MRLKITTKNHLYGDAAGGTSIKDEDTGKTVGQLLFSTGGGRSVSLFGDKYRGDFKRFEECEAFVKGVEAVLNHVVAIKE
jgi:hypothetical protein